MISGAMYCRVPKRKETWLDNSEGAGYKRESKEKSLRRERRAAVNGRHRSESVTMGRRRSLGKREGGGLKPMGNKSLRKRGGEA